MQSRGPAAPAGEAGPLDEETHARVLDHQTSGLIQGISEKGLHLVRMRAPASGSRHAPGTSLELESVNVLGTTRHRDLSSMAHAELQEVVKGILTDHPEVCLAFYNRAGNLTLKKHAFTLLPGIGDSKAMAMVQARGRTGWEAIEALDADCQIDAAQLLSERLCSEIVDRHMTPNLLDLLIRA
jgi:predicted nucleic acid-binding OB-fold protein